MSDKQTGGMRPKFKPYPHQKRAVDKLLANNGAIVMAHGTGSGKTFSAIYGHEKLRQSKRGSRALVVVPAGLKKNFSDSITEFTTSSHQVVGAKGEKGTIYPTDLRPGKTYTVVSYAMFRKAPVALVKATGADTLIFDEYHRARDPRGVTFKAAMQARAVTRNFMGLTGSVVNNDPSDVAPLLQVAARGKFMSKSQFKQRYKARIGKTQGFWGGKKFLATMKNLDDMSGRVSPHVDYISSDDLGKDMPRKAVERVDVRMSPEQEKLYDYAMKKLNPITRYKIRKNLPVTQKEAAHIFTTIRQARQAANSMATMDKRITLKDSSEQTPKVKRLLDDTSDHLQKIPDAQVVLYSNLIKGGIDVLSAGLKARGIDHAVFVGKGRDIGGSKVTAQSRNTGVSQFKAGKKKVIIVSPAGAEGLDLKNATMFQSLDGHFNPERTLQAEARARRIKGLAHRKPKNRVVKVKRYFSVKEEPSWAGKLFGKKRDATTDEWVHNVAKRKHTLNEQFRTAIKKPKKYKRRWRDFKTNEWRYEY